MNSNQDIAEHPFRNSLVLADNTLRLAEQILNLIDLENAGDSECVVCSYFDHSIELSQSIRELVVMGRQSASAILLRSLLSATARIKFCRVNNGSLVELASGAMYEQHKLVSSCIELCDEDDPRLSEFKKREEKLRGNKKLSDFDIYQRAGMSDFYKTTYRHLSKLSHMDLRVVEDRMTVTDGKIEKVKRSTSYDNAFDHLIGMTEWLLMSCQECDEIFRLDQIKTIQEFQNYLAILKNSADY